MPEVEVDGASLGSLSRLHLPSARQARRTGRSPAERAAL